jgi:hypothetical protein
MALAQHPLSLSADTLLPADYTIYIGLALALLISVSTHTISQLRESHNKTHMSATLFSTFYMTASIITSHAWSHVTAFTCTVNCYLSYYYHTLSMLVALAAPRLVLIHTVTYLTSMAGIGAAVIWGNYCIGYMPSLMSLYQSVWLGVILWHTGVARERLRVKWTLAGSLLFTVLSITYLYIHPSTLTFIVSSFSEVLPWAIYAWSEPCPVRKTERPATWV